MTGWATNVWTCFGKNLRRLAVSKPRFRPRLDGFFVTLLAFSPAPVLAQNILTQSLSPAINQSSTANSNYTTGTLSAVPMAGTYAMENPALLLMNGSGSGASSLTIPSITGTNINGSVSQQFGFQTPGFAIQSGSYQSSSLAGPPITVTSSATLLANDNNSIYFWTSSFPGNGAAFIQPGSGEWLVPGALNVISYGGNGWGTYGSSGQANGGGGGAVTVTQAGGILYAGPYDTFRAINPWNPSLSGLYATSVGGNALAFSSSASGAGNGGAGGAVNVTTSAGASIQLLNSINSNSIILNGITALSQGGLGSYWCDNRDCTAEAFSAPGAGGAVTVTHNGAISSNATYSTATIFGQIGISAASIGAPSVCMTVTCTNGYSSTNPPVPGGSGNVAVTVGSTGSINLTQGSAIGVFAMSAIGDITQGLDIPAPGTVNVAINQGAQITVGNASAMFSAGVLAVSTGSPALLAPFAQSPISNVYLAASNAVSVSNFGAINATGELAVGIAALSLGGGGTATQTPTGSLSYLGSSAAMAALPSGAVSVTNPGTIVTNGASAFGIVALSAASGGMVTLDFDAAFSSTGAVNSGLILGNGSSTAGGAPGGTVFVQNNGSIQTGDTAGNGNMAIGILAQSIGGGGGTSGGSGAAAFVGDSAGGGGNGGQVTLYQLGTVTTYNDGAIGVLTQSIGGGGGNGGNARGVFTAVGGQGGEGGSGNTVSIMQNGAIVTYGDFAHSVVGQSIGGGGGNGGYAKSVGVFVSDAIGGAGGSGGAGGAVTFTGYFASVSTAGQQSHGLLLQSIGGGGGNGGAANSYSVGLAFSAAISVGGTGGTGGTGGAVTVTNSVSPIATIGADSLGVLAQSIGGGGGHGGGALGKALALSVPAEAEIPTISASVTLGGKGGVAGAGGAVQVTNEQSAIQTLGDRATGVLAQSIGGGGGNGGDSTALSSAVTGKSTNVNASVAIGGGGGGGGSGGGVSVVNQSTLTSCPSCSPVASIISIAGSNASGILAQSIGGGGGNGGAGNVTIATQALSANTSVSVGLSVGGSASGGGSGGTVTVSNADGMSSIITVGSGSQGILAQSIGGGGGNAGGGATAGSGNTVNVNIALGGTGGDGGHGGAVSITNNGAIVTGAPANSALPFVTGGDAVGIMAQSIGGGGGNAGSSDPAAAVPSGGTVEQLVTQYTALVNGPPSASYAASLAIGGRGGSSGDGGSIGVTNGGSVLTYGVRAYGVLAQSIGGGGGSGGAVNGTSNASGSGTVYSANVGIGGNGGGAGYGSAVTVTNSGSIFTNGYAATGIMAQSIGGGGGVGAEGSVGASSTFNIGLGMNGRGGGAGSGGAVTVSSAGSITTNGDDAPAILAQSIGGGGGAGSSGCTNSQATFGVSIQNQSASSCFGNGTSATLGLSQATVSVGGSDGSSGAGSEVTVNVSGPVVTTGARSMGVVAQSIAGGGGYFSGSSLNTNTPPTLSATLGGTNGATSNSSGSTSLVNVAVNVQAGGSITTWGAGGWGVLAQSIGGGGGFAADPSLPIINSSYWYQANTLAFRTNTDNTYADGGNVAVTVNGAIVTNGVNAHGVVAQSIGGGGGIMNSGANQALSMGNTTQIYGTSPGTFSGTGYGVNVSVPAGGSINANGSGSIGIVAQSSGNSTYTRAITITIGGSVVGGTGDNAAGVMLIGGANQSDPDYSGVNSITVNSGGVLGTLNGPGGVAITTGFGFTNVLNNGTITGSVNLGSTPGDFTNNGTWNIGSGTSTVVASSTLTNKGTIHLVATGSGPTVISGGFSQTATGRLVVDVNSLAATPAASLLIQGNAQIAGTIVPNALALLPGDLRILTATGNLSYSAQPAESFLFNWRTTTDGGQISLTPSQNFTPQGATLSPNEAAVAIYLQRGWSNRDASLAGRFAYLAQVADGDAYRKVLQAYSGRGLNAGASLSLLFSADMLAAPLSCPIFAGETARLTQDECAWAKTVGGVARNTASDGYSASSAMWRMGGQRLVASDLYLGGAFGVGVNRASADGYGGKANAYDASVALKYMPGNWELSGAAALGTASLTNQRTVALPAAGMFAARSALEQSNTQTYTVGGRLRAAYTFAFDGWYARPYSDLDIVALRVPAFSEQPAGADSISLSRQSSTSTLVRFTPMLEFGLRRALEDGWILRPTLAFGVSLQSNSTTRSQYTVVGTSPLNGAITSTTTVPRALGRLSAWVQVYRAGGFDFRLEYDLLGGTNYLGQSGGFKAAYQF